MQLNGLVGKNVENYFLASLISVKKYVMKVIARLATILVYSFVFVAQKKQNDHVMIYSGSVLKFATRNIHVGFINVWIYVTLGPAALALIQASGPVLVELFSSMFNVRIL